MDSLAAARAKEIINAIVENGVVYVLTDAFPVSYEVDLGFQNGLWLLSDSHVGESLSAAEKFPGVYFTDCSCPKERYSSVGIGISKDDLSKTIWGHPINRALSCEVHTGTADELQSSLKPILRLITSGDTRDELYDTLCHNMTSALAGSTAKAARAEFVELRRHLQVPTAKVSVLLTEPWPAFQPRTFDSPWEQKLANVADTCAVRRGWNLLGPDMGITLSRKGTANEYTGSLPYTLGANRRTPGLVWIQPTDGNAGANQNGFGLSTASIDANCRRTLCNALGVQYLAEAVVTRTKVAECLRPFIAALPGLREAVKAMKQDPKYIVDRRDLYNLFSLLSTLRNFIDNNERINLYSLPTQD